MLSLVVALTLTSLPDRIVIDSPTAAMTSTHDIAVLDGALWWRRHGQERWTLIPPDGLPAPRGRLESLKELAADVPLVPAPFRRPKRIERISADGDNLIAVSNDGRVYYVKLSTLDWTDVWGPTPLAAPLSVKGLDAFAMSHRKIPYEDLDGNPHPISAGVTTLYALKGGGTQLVYADPWLPPNFDRALCLPERGTFVAVSLAASASTLFVIDEAGRTFTRLVDFDIHGDNPALPYSYAREKRTGPRQVVRTLPAPEWVMQPPIPGKHTLRIGIEQNGTTNADRELRVEGDGGWWQKRLTDAHWTFMKGELPPPRGASVRIGPPDHSPKVDQTLTARDAWPGTRVTLEQWNPLCPPAQLRVAASGENVVLQLPFHFGLSQGTEDERVMEGALLLPRGDGTWLKHLRSAAKPGENFLDVKIEVTRDEVRVSKLPMVDLHFSRR
ncbi:MAG: hypothetical protein JNM17_02460 [Archangium sp.]|nr:hypothetical protein [Archangium sp.]